MVKEGIYTKVKINEENDRSSDAHINKMLIKFEDGTKVAGEIDFSKCVFLNVNGRDLVFYVGKIGKKGMILFRGDYYVE